MARLLRMPEVAANAVEAVLSEWPIPENTPFRSADSIATVETEKAVVEVTADADGVILKTLVPAGAMVEVGAPIALLGEPGEHVEDVGTLLLELGVGSDVAPATDAPSTATPAVAPSTVAPSAPDGVADETGVRIFSSPLARRLAKEAGLSIADIRGTGPGGRIVRRDVEQATVSASVATSAVTSAVAAAYEDIPHTRMRRAIAARLTESTRDAPHFFLQGTARVDKLLKLRARLNGSGDGSGNDSGNGSGAVSVSVNDLVVTAAARAHVMVPAMNVIWTPDAVRSFSAVDISVAVATELGLVTPVLRNVDQMTLSAVAAAGNDLVRRARSGQLQQEELEGGTLTVTNLGMFGTEGFAAIINPPQSAILAVGAALEKPVVSKGRLRVGTVMSFTLSVDHRPIDGATAAQWMGTFISLLEEPVRILL
ncbi:MAG TPA: dihydrolipoamide acetyltransferase family protein [Dermatophilaceae bacterium]|nr:dihydrolipoamide acetyltransferase family protein [Dermatophilaceae bacterium]